MAHVPTLVQSAARLMPEMAIAVLGRFPVCQRTSGAIFGLAIRVSVSTLRNRAGLRSTPKRAAYRPRDLRKGLCSNSGKNPNIIPIPSARDGLPAAAMVARPTPPAVDFSSQGIIPAAGVFQIKARAAVHSALNQPTEGAGWPALLPPTSLMELRAA